ncbi:hypothetical protein D3C87_1465360 [compost metagenome]
MHEDAIFDGSAEPDGRHLEMDLRGTLVVFGLEELRVVGGNEDPAAVEWAADDDCFRHYFSPLDCGLTSTLSQPSFSAILAHCCAASLDSYGFVRTFLNFVRRAKMS